MGTRQWRRLLILTAMIAAFAIGASGVSAHAQFKSADPPPNATVNKAPTQITLTFSEETSATKSGGSVVDASGATVSTGFKVDLNERTKMTIDLKPNLPNGVYTVKWNTLTEDDNGTANGAFTFTVQAAATGSAIAGTAPAAPAAPVTTTAPSATSAPAATAASTATRPTTTSAATGTGGGTTAVAATSATLPKSGNSDSGSPVPWAIAALVVAVLAIAGGLVFRLRIARH